MKQRLPFASYRTRAPRGAVQRLVNCYPEQGQGKGDVYLYGAPGLTEFADTQVLPARGAHMFQGVLHVVAGSKLFTVNAAGSVTEVASVPGTNPVVMAENGAQLVIVTNPDGYVWNGSTIQQITDPDFTSRGANDCVFIDNFILFVEPSTGRFFGCELGDALVYDALDFATAEAYPDKIIGIDADHGQAFLAGEVSCELWDNVGGAGFPFRRNFNGIVEQGCAAGKSVIKADQTLFWIDDTRIARRLDGVTPQRVSQHGVEQAWQDYARVDDAEGYTFTQDGHINVVWHFPSAQATWLYDVTAQSWYERASYGMSEWRAAWLVNGYSKVLVGDRLTGKIGVLDQNAFQEFGSTMIMEWTYPSVYADANLAFHHMLEMVLETGVGNANAPDPKIMLEASDDGGQTYQALDDLNIGKQGAYRTLVSWHALGSSEDRVYRASISDPVRRAVYDTQIDVEGGLF